MSFGDDTLDPANIVTPDYHPRSYAKDVLAQMNKAKPRLDVGYEVEGMLKGLWTLFVYGDVPVSVIDKAIIREKVSHIYFGDDCRKDNWKQLYQFLSVQPSRCAVTVESPYAVPSDCFFRPNFYAVLPLHHMASHITLANYISLAEVRTGYERTLRAQYKPFPEDRIQVKFNTNQQTFMCQLSKMNVNSISDILQDSTVWQGDAR